eukprot:6208259-Pleurochrysis_carterae.AAC.1
MESRGGRHRLRSVCPELSGNAKIVYMKSQMRKRRSSSLPLQTPPPPPAAVAPPPVPAAPS